MITSQDHYMPIVPQPNPVARTMRVLIIDDNQFDRTRLCRMIEKMPMDVQICEAETLTKGWYQLGQVKYDIIILDNELPEGPSLAALTRLREHKVNGRSPIIMVSGSAAAVVAVSALKRGCVDYISKSDLSQNVLETAMEFAVSKTTQDAQNDMGLKGAITSKIQSFLEAQSECFYPEIATILSDLNRLRASVGVQDDMLDHQLAEIEQRCVGLWRLMKFSSEGLRPN